jgi:hypothetical protein
MCPSRPSNDALAWRLVAEAADRFADEAYALAEASDITTELRIERSTRAKALAMLAGDLIPDDE